MSITNQIFYIMKNINYRCSHNDYFEMPYNHIKKINGIIDLLVDMDKYIIDYRNNEFLLIYDKDTNLKKVNKIVISNIDTDDFRTSELNTLRSSYYNEEKRKNSFLNHYIDENKEEEFINKSNLSYGISGYLSNSICNSIIIHLLKNKELNKNTIFIFSLKNIRKSRDIDDIYTFCMSELNVRNIKYIINLDTSFNEINNEKKIVLENLYNYDKSYLQTLKSYTKDLIDKYDIIDLKTNTLSNKFKDLLDMDIKCINIKLLISFLKPRNKYIPWNNQDLFIDDISIENYHEILYRLIQNL